VRRVKRCGYLPLIYTAPAIAFIKRAPGFKEEEV
jgi:hypothetical protein